jgi:hypothetical protein
MLPAATDFAVINTNSKLIIDSILDASVERRIESALGYHTKGQRIRY